MSAVCVNKHFNQQAFLTPLVEQTNTDCVLLDLTKGKSTFGTVLATTKVPTTSNISLGVVQALRNVVEQAHMNTGDIDAVAMGTTHFVNALVERKVEHLERVSVIRLCGKYTRGTPPFAGFPFELRKSESSSSQPSGYDCS